MRPTIPSSSPSSPGRTGGGATRTRRRCERQLPSDGDVVEVAPAPRLAGLERAHDRMLRSPEVRRGVPAARRVAAPDVPAGEVLPETHPALSEAQALLTSLGARAH